MEGLPTEVVEMIIWNMKDGKNLSQCRLVGSLWNKISVKFWRELPSTTVSLLTDVMIQQFISDMGSRIQVFPFKKFKIKSVNSDNLFAVRDLLQDCRHHIEDLEIEDLIKFPMTDDQVRSFFCLLDASILTKLKQFSFGAIRRPDMDMTQVNMDGLRVLRCYSAELNHPIPAALIRGAPNLDFLEISIDVSTSDLAWPLPDSCKRIPTIHLNLEIGIEVNATTSALSTLSRSLQEWGNIQVKTMSVWVSVDHDHLIPQAHFHIQQILDTHGTFIEVLEVLRWPQSQYSQRLNLLNLTSLNSLTINLGDNWGPIQPLEQDPFEKLKSVTLLYCEEPVLLLKEAFPTVTEFQFHFSTRHRALNTRWCEIFPNLTSFTYTAATAIDFDNLGFVISDLRMDSLQHLEYNLFSFDSERSRDKKRKREVNRRINDIFSGLTDLSKIVTLGNIAKRQGKEFEQTFWLSMEKLRRPCPVNMKGLKTFKLDHQVDDEFGRGILAQMRPLDLLVIGAEEVSMEIFVEIIAKHNSFSSTDN